MTWLTNLLRRLPGTDVAANDDDWGAPLPVKWSSRRASCGASATRCGRSASRSRSRPEQTRLLKLDGREFQVERASTSVVVCRPEPATPAARREATKAGWRRVARGTDDVLRAAAGRAGLKGGGRDRVMPNVKTYPIRVVRSFADGGPALSRVVPFRAPMLHDVRVIRIEDAGEFHVHAMPVDDAGRRVVELVTEPATAPAAQAAGWAVQP